MTTRNSQLASNWYPIGYLINLFLCSLKLLKNGSVLCTNIWISIFKWNRHDNSKFNINCAVEQILRQIVYLQIFFLHPLSKGGGDEICIGCHLAIEFIDTFTQSSSNTLYIKKFGYIFILGTIHSHFQSRYPLCFNCTYMFFSSMKSSFRFSCHNSAYQCWHVASLVSDDSPHQWYAVHVLM